MVTFTQVFIVLIFILGIATLVEFLFAGVQGLSILVWLLVIIALIYGLRGYHVEKNT